MITIITISILQLLSSLLVTSSHASILSGGKKSSSLTHPAVPSSYVDVSTLTDHAVSLKIHKQRIPLPMSLLSVCVMQTC